MPSKILDDLVSATKALIKDIVADEVSDESNGAINDKSAEIVVDAASDTIDNIARTSPDSRQKTDLLGKKIQIAEIAQETQEFYERDDLDTIQKNVLSTINILNKFFPFSGDATVIAEKAIELRNKRVGELEKIMSEYPEHFMRVPDHLKEIKKLPASTDTTPTTEFDGADARASHPTRVKLPENLPGSPLIADREGDGISVSFLETSNTWFDIDADGFRELLAWPDGLDDWILVLDWNGNGVIDDSTEWFGGLETDGFAELANLDNNKDGHIDLADAQFADLLFWADINQDGVSDPGELTPVQNEVLYIDLNASLINEINNGNPVTHRSAVQWLDGTTTNIDDIWFRFDQWDSRSKDESIDGISDDVLVLPELIGRGDMASLWQAMSENSDLKQSALSLLESLENGDIDGYLNQFDFFLLQWAGVDTKDMVTPTTVNTPEMLSFLRAFSGRDYDAWTGNLGVNATALVEKNFDDISGSLAARFAFQAPISSFLMSEDSETFAFNHPLSVLMSIFDYNPQTDMLSLRENNSTLSFEALIQDNVLTLSQAFNLLRLFAPDVAAQDTDLSELSGGTHVAIVHAGLSHGHYYDLDQGTDRVPGGPNADIFQGGGGDDTLLGQGGKDVFIWSKGHGNDVIHDDGTGQLILTDVLADGVEIARSQNNSSDVVIKILETSETILLENLLTSQSHGIQSLVFRDGTSMERAAIEEAAWFRGSSKTEYFWGYAADEIFIGGGGDDTIHGGCGKDVFLWSLYHGNDVIRDDGSGHLVLQDVSSEQVVFGRAEAAANDLTIGVTETNETILIKNFFWNETQGIDRLTFKDGSSLDRNGIISAVQNAEATAPPPHEISSISLNSSGQDQFSWTKGSGDYLISGQGSGRVFLRDVAPEGVVFGRSFNYRNNLEITVTETGETLTVKQ
ncbi:MAG: calcium-binding protein, partial [Rhodospirillaceae bacterium]